MTPWSSARASSAWPAPGAPRSAGCPCSCWSATSPARAPRAWRPGCSRRSPRPTSATSACCARTSSRARCGPRSPPSWRSSRASTSATARAAPWWWRPIATTPRSCAACTRCTARWGSTRTGSTPSACRREEPGLSPRVAGGILAPADGHVDPRATVGALAAALELAGGELVSGVEVVGLETSAGRVTAVRTAGGRVATEQRRDRRRLLERRGPRDRRSAARRCGPSRASCSSCARAPGRPAPAERIVRSPRCYLLSRGDGRVVLGATVEEQGFDTSVTADGVYRLLEAAWEVLPDVSELELVSARAGLRPGTPDNEPVIGAGRARGPGVGHRPLPQRRPARPADRRRRGRAAWPAASRRRAVAGFAPARVAA